MCHQPFWSSLMASYMLDEDEIPETVYELDTPIVEDDSDCSISSRNPSRCRHNGTAKLVSVVFAGKPQLVQVASYEGSTSRRRSAILHIFLSHPKHYYDIKCIN